MKNKLLGSWHTERGGTIVVLETPCHPASWYAGYANLSVSMGWYPTTNDTCYFHRSEKAAFEAAREMAKRVV